jgi:hypothetical protein
MRRMTLLMIVAIAMMSGSLAALEFSLTIDQVNPYMVHGTLSISNPTSQDVLLEFPSAGTFDLMVDGNASAVTYPSILTNLLIPADSTTPHAVSFVGFNPLTPGTHVAQAIYVLLDNPPAGEPQTFIYDPTPLSNISDLEYDFSVTSVGQQGMTGSLQMYNPNSLPWELSFPNSIVARIFVDGEAPSTMYPPMSITVEINPGGFHTEEIFHVSDTPYSPGAHIAEARLFLNDDIQVGAAQTFVVEPSAAEDEIAPPLPMLSLKVGPNPCRDHLSVSSSSKRIQTFSIYDIKGRKVFETSGPGEFIWDGRDFSQRVCPPGLYYIKTRLEDQHAIKRFVKLQQGFPL